MDNHYQLMDKIVPSESSIVIGGVSKKGVTHSRFGKENQDSIFSQLKDKVLIMVVADGHGGDSYSRSKIGSKTASKVAAIKVHEFMKTIFDTSTLQKNSGYINNEILNYQLDNLKESIINTWKTECTKTLIDTPILLNKVQQTELNNENKNSRTLYQLFHDNTPIELSKQKYQRIKDEPLTVFGTTLLVVAKYQQHLIFLQLGDGNIIVTKNGKIIIPFIDENMIGNETNSLCERNALDRFKSNYMRLDEEISTIVVSSDGIYNSFTNEEDFKTIGKHLIEEYHNNKLEFNNNVNDFVSIMATKGSGDDCSIVYYLNNINYKEDHNGIK